MSGRRVLITGGGSGIGAATAAHLNASGWTAIVADTTPPAGGLELDVASTEGWTRAIEAVWPLDGLVNCAGIRDIATVTELTADQIDRMLAIHVRGGLTGIREVSRRWIAEQRSGAVVNIASVNATHAVAGQAHYVAAKAAVSGQIRVNAVAPGLIRTPMTEVRFADPAQLDRMLTRIPMRRHGEPREIAAAIAFLLSDDAAYITGVTLPVDGGWTAC
jgi:3-oxoacyl-[acyl-carrier protein] reductase